MISNSFVFNSYYGIKKGAKSVFAPQHSIIAIRNNELQNGWCIGKKCINLFCAAAVELSYVVFAFLKKT